MKFEEYLVSKKIDSQAFKSAEPDRWSEWNNLFDQMSPASFTAQKLYLINPLRRKYKLKTPETESLSKPTISAVPKPVIKPRPKIK